MRSTSSFSDTTKNVLIASMFVHLKCNKFVKHASDLPILSPRILLSGPAGWNCPLFSFNCSFVFFPSDLFPWPGLSVTWVLTGSEIYQETLTKALARHFGARLLIVDSLLLPGVRCKFFIFYHLLSWNFIHPFSYESLSSCKASSGVKKVRLNCVTL